MICPACDYDTLAKVSEFWSFTIELNAKSGNQIKSSGKGRSGWPYRNHRKACATAVGRAAPSIPKASRRRRLWITRLWAKGQRAYDKDNLYWGMKPLVDEIKEQGWIKEDSPKWVERICRQEKSPDGVGRIEIRIEEFDE